MAEAIGSSNRSVDNFCCALTLYIPQLEAKNKQNQIKLEFLLNEADFQVILCTSIKTGRVAEKYRADENIDHSVANHRPKTIVRIKPVNVRGHDNTACKGVQAGILRMKAAIEPDTRTKSVLGGIARSQAFPAALRQEFSLFLRRLECQGIRLIFVTALVERRVGCWGYLCYAGHVCLQRIYDGIARRGGT